MSSIQTPKIRYLLINYCSEGLVVEFNLERCCKQTFIDL
jgi:hypothetical protein